MRELSMNEIRMVSGGSIDNYLSSGNVDRTALVNSIENTVVESGKYFGGLIGDKISNLFGDFGKSIELDSLLSTFGSKAGSALGDKINSKIFA